MGKNRIEWAKTSMFKKLFKKKRGISEHVEPIVESLEAVAVSDSADKLLESPREMAVPSIATLEHVLPESTEFVPTDVESVVAPTASNWWRRKSSKRLRKQEGPAEQEIATHELVTLRPIRLFIGYVPDVTEKDARFFAMGVAEKNVESEYISYLGVFRYGTGYAYEIQEGGHGHSYLTRLVKYFSQLPQGLHDAETAVYIATASRMVQVEKTADGGLVCIQLPESYKAKETDWLKPEKKLKLLRDQNSGLMMIAGTFLGISLLVLAGAFLTRYVPRERPAERVWYDTVALDELPVSQWDSMISETEKNHYILALTFNGKEWCRKTEVAKTCGSDSKHSATAHTSVPATASMASSPALTRNAVVKDGASVPSANSASSASAAVPASHALPPLPPVPGK